MWRNLAVVGVVTAVAVAALVDGLRGGEGEAAAPTEPGETEPVHGRELEGPDAPAAGALPGTLLVAEPERRECELRRIAFDTASVADTGVDAACRVWVAPEGDLAVIPVSGDPAITWELDLVRVRPDGDSELVRELGTAVGEVAWSADGARVAWCTPGPVSFVLDVGSGSQVEVPGCAPRFGPGGGLLTRPAGPNAPEVWLDGEPVLRSEQLELGFDPASDGSLDVVAFDVAPDGLIAVTVVRYGRGGTTAALQLWRDGRLEASAPLPPPARQELRLGDFLAFSPTGDELAVGYAADAGQLAVVDVALGRVVLEAIDQRGLAWSPDGAWLALAGEEEIRVYGALRDDPAYVLELGAASLGWGGGGEEPNPEG